jgi:hypothetical protein
MDYTAQVGALNAAGCERIFGEKRSGKSALDRNKLSRWHFPKSLLFESPLDLDRHTSLGSSCSNTGT